MAAWLYSSGGGCGAHGLFDVRKEIHDRLLEIGNEEAVGDPCFRQLLDQHFERLPLSYSIDLLADKAEDVLLHRRILAECADHERRPVFHARFLQCIQEAKPQQDAGSSLPPNPRRDPEIVLLHEIIFSSIDKPKLLCQLSALLSELGLNIRDAHVFSTTDGFCLGIFVVDGWCTEETDGLLQRLKERAKHVMPYYLRQPQREYSARKDWRF